MVQHLLQCDSPLFPATRFPNGVSNTVKKKALAFPCQVPFPKVIPADPKRAVCASGYQRANVCCAPHKTLRRENCTHLAHNEST